MSDEGTPYTMNVQNPSPTDGANVPWQPIAILTQQLGANCAALATRYPAMAEQLRDFRPNGELVVRVVGERLEVARRSANGTPEVMVDPVPPAESRRVAQALLPGGACTESLLVAGIGRGWLWHSLHTAPVSTPGMPGHRPPLYFLVRRVEELWIAMHVHDWRGLLADPRVLLFVGADAVAQVSAFLASDRLTPWPKVSVGLDPTLWPKGANLQSLTAPVVPALNGHFHRTLERLKSAYADHAPTHVADTLALGRPLRVLGITSRYTTYLQHSMRDWLAAFRGMGHDARLLIEEFDHQVMTNLVYAETCEAYAPDLVLMIDHCRGEMSGLPEAIPCVMWVQDHMPHIFSARTGAAQGPLDYVLGFGRQECVDQFGYPRDRFMPARNAVNEHRFAPAAFVLGAGRTFDCDVCYVGHASTPADVFLADALKRTNSGDTRRLLTDVYERLRAVYDAGGCVTETAELLDLFRASAAANGLGTGNVDPLTDLFRQRINNAMFRHQALAWVADMGVDLRLYGNGWERHPRFARHAHGPAENQGQLAEIYCSSRINLQVQPHGAVHQRLCDGLAAGGFFLIRYCPADEVECVYRPIWEWCVQHGVRTDDNLRRRATPKIHALLAELERLKGRDPFGLGVPLVTSMALAADGDYCNSAKSIWPEYDRVSFDSADTLRARVRHYLDHPGDRDEIAAAMRRRVVDRLTYTATTRRLLDFVSSDLIRRYRPAHAASAA
jgi:hypothetical protein